MLLAAALAVRAPRLGHVCVDLATIRDDRDRRPRRARRPAGAAVAASRGLGRRPRGEPAGRRRRGRGEAGRSGSSARALPRPLLARGAPVAADLLARNEPADGVDAAAARRRPGRLFDGDEPDLQRARRRGRGAAPPRRRRRRPRHGQDDHRHPHPRPARRAGRAPRRAPPLVALAAPTGKAAARLEEAVHEEASTLERRASDRERLLELEASTLHRLLGWRPDSPSRFRHDRRNQLPHDVVIVDETSMVSLSLMARLLEAVRRDARLILVGDPGSSPRSRPAPCSATSSARPPTRCSCASRRARARRGRRGRRSPATAPPATSRSATASSSSRRVHRFGGAIADLAEADPRRRRRRALAVLARRPRRRHAGSTSTSPSPTALERLRPVRDGAVAAGRAVIEAARAGDAARRDRARSAPSASSAPTAAAPTASRPGTRASRGWLARRADRFAEERLVRRPAAARDPERLRLRLYNGDTGVIVARDDGRRAPSSSARASSSRSARPGSTPSTPSTR